MTPNPDTRRIDREVLLFLCERPGAMFGELLRGVAANTDALRDSLGRLSESGLIAGDGEAWTITVAGRGAEI